MTQEKLNSIVNEYIVLINGLKLRGIRCWIFFIDNWKDIAEITISLIAGFVSGYMWLFSEIVTPKELILINSFFVFIRENITIFCAYKQES